MGLIVFLIAAAIVLLIIGVIIHGLFYLLIIGVVVLALCLLYGVWRLRRANKRRHPRR